jgi:phosphorylcholine metabolism protein LicD
MNGKVAARALRDLIAAYKTQGVTAWIQDGTLLGAVRTGQVIPWDKDTDVGIYSWEWTPAVHAAIITAGFKEEAAWNSPHKDFHQKYSRDRILIDVFHYYRHDDGSIYHGLRGGKVRFYYPREFTLSPIDFENVTLPAPFPPESFVRTKYGPN